MKVKKINGFTKKQVKVFLKNKIRVDKQWAYKAILAILKNQTESEQRSLQSLSQNKIGFSLYDAPILTLFANKIKYKKSISYNEEKYAMILISKYTEQLINLSDERKLEIQLRKYYENT